MFGRRPTFFRAADALTKGRCVEARVRWFDTAKGFGFVALPDGTSDAFLPMAALRRANYDFVREGAAITCEIGAGAKGPLVVSVIALDNSAAGIAAARADEAERPKQLLDGAVRWFEPDKGYGFITPAGGGKDIFVHARALRRSGVAELGAGQRVRVAVVIGRKGPEADQITLI